jgi:hypothetical protein
VAPTRTAQSPPPPLARSAPAPARSLRLGPLARLEAWWWTGPLGHLVAGTLDLAPLFARYYAHVARERTTRRLARTRRRARI